MPGARLYDPSGIVRDFRFGAIRPPTEGEGGVWVNSVPPGCRVFASNEEGLDVQRFSAQLTSWIGHRRPERKKRRRRKDILRGYHGTTPMTLPYGDKRVWVAVEKVLVGDESPDSFLPDGEQGTAQHTVDGVARYYKIYHREREGDSTLSVIALFQVDAPPGDETADQYLPTKRNYDFDDAKLTHDLANRGVSPETAEELVNRFSRAGKIIFGPPGDRVVLEWLPGNKWMFTDLKR